MSIHLRANCRQTNFKKKLGKKIYLGQDPNPGVFESRKSKGLKSSGSATLACTFKALRGKALLVTNQLKGVEPSPSPPNKQHLLLLLPTSLPLLPPAGTAPGLQLPQGAVGHFLSTSLKL
jgi:hypothetical protein